MSLSQRFASLNRAQHSRPFKIAASTLVALLTIGTIVAYTVRVNAPVDSVVAAAQPDATDPATEAASAEDRIDEDAALAVSEAATRTTQRVIDDVLSSRSDPTGFALVALAIGGVAIGAIWLGLGLTYLGILVVASAVLLPMALWAPTRAVGLAGLGLAGLVMSFTVLLQGLRVLFSGPGATLAIAKNVLAEAVRMKISLVFIVMVLLLLAALPGVLNDDQPLRYRVQAFMSFGTGLSFWVIAVLTILFSAATLSFEQRRRVIWQTMTKPVSAWSYVLGKWLGVVGLNAVLLLVCSAGIFGFVEYLRGQPAVGEVRPYVTSSNVTDAVSPDRLALEQQVLTARVLVPIAEPLDKSTPQFQAAVDEFIEQRRLSTPEFGADPAQREEVETSLYDSYNKEFLSVAPGRNKQYKFENLGVARDRNLPLVFRHRVNIGSNAPDMRAVVSFAYGPLPAIPEQMGAGVYHTVQITPSVLLESGRVYRVSDENFEQARRAVLDGRVPGTYVETEDIVEADGSLFLEVVNGQLAVDPGSGRLVVVGNERTVVFPPDGLEMSYQWGGFRQNFLRAMVLLWVKLAFLSMLTIAASTFLSFPVACMLSFGSFLAAEGSSYLLQSVSVFGWTDDDGSVQVFRAIAAVITTAVGRLFSVYDQLNPLESIVNGRLIGWGDTTIAVASLAVATLVLFVIASFVFARRELAMYSGK